MIIELLLDALYALFNLLTTPINIPSLPDEVNYYIETFFNGLAGYAGIVAAYTPFSYLMTLFGIILAVDIGIKLYHFVMWVIKKIPMAGIS